MKDYWHAENHAPPVPASRPSRGNGLHVRPAAHWLVRWQSGKAVVMSQWYCPTMSPW
jgi:hypothetical protein